MSDKQVCVCVCVCVISRSINLPNPAALNASFTRASLEVTVVAPRVNIIIIIGESQHEKSIIALVSNETKRARRGGGADEERTTGITGQWT
jgi:hypothetical protein